MQDLERRANLLKKENPMFKCFCADGTVITLTGLDPLFSAITDNMDGVKLLRVEAEDPAEACLCGLVNALLVDEEDK